ncbi:MAG: transglutaminase-like domain-containing protein [Oscillospiraceae bacterium]|nr:transglutaminase-like domain-containing protein [Oscillospiraceae bacterium]
MKKTFDRKTAILLAVLSIAALAAAVYFIRTVKNYAWVNLHLYRPDGETVEKIGRGSDVHLPDGEAIENYTFIGWRGPDGKIELRDPVIADGDLYYSAVYAVALKSDASIPLLQENAKGELRPDEPMTHAEAADVLVSLLALPVEAVERFSDLEAENAYGESANVLKTLGVVEGETFGPENALKKSELISMLAAFFPPTAETSAFSDLAEDAPEYAAFCLAVQRGWIKPGANGAVEPDKTLTRREAAMILIRVVGRDTELREDDLRIIPDVSLDDPDYAQMLAAAGSDYAGADLQALHVPDLSKEEGFSFDGSVLRYIQKDGTYLKNGEINGFRFDKYGRYTSGNEELDRMLRRILESITDKDMDDVQRLRAAYDYILSNCSYRKGSFYEIGEQGWSVQEAYKMLETGYGNCYAYAGTYCELCRAMGYDMTAFSGTIAGRMHGWCELELDGTTYVFDPEMQWFKYWSDKEYIDMFMLDEVQSHKWSYRKEL